MALVSSHFCGLLTREGVIEAARVTKLGPASVSVTGSGSLRQRLPLTRRLSVARCTLSILLANRNTRRPFDLQCRPPACTVSLQKQVSALSGKLVYTPEMAGQIGPSWRALFVAGEGGTWRYSFNADATRY